MPIIIAVLAALGGAIWWWVRNNPRDALSIADDAVTIARNAPRKIAFRRQQNAHPVEGIDDPRLAVATLAGAYIALDDLPTREDREKLNVVLRKTYQMDADTAEEMAVLAKWLLDQCGGAAETITRTSRRLFKFDGAASWDTLTHVLSEVTTGAVSDRQQDAIVEMRQKFHIR